MHRLFKPIFWTFLFLVMMLAIDQLLVQVPPMHPAHAAVANFYQDFRSRLIDLAFSEKKTAPKTVEAVIAERQKKPTTVKTAPKATQRYLYSDDQGVLQFVDSLEEIPEKYRTLAQPMGQ